MCNVWLVVADSERRSYLEQLIRSDPGLDLVGSSEEHPADCVGGGSTDVFLIDLAHDRACHPQFWAAFRVLWPASRLVTVTDLPVQPHVLGAALNAGGYATVAWGEPPCRILQAVHGVGSGKGFIPLGDVLRAITEFFSAEWLPAVPIQCGRLAIDLKRRRVFRDDVEVELTRIEFNLLAYLGSNMDRIIPISELAQFVWGQSQADGPLTRQVKDSVMRLRHKIEPHPRTPCYILNRHGQGYWMPAQPSP